MNTTIRPLARVRVRLLPLVLLGLAGCASFGAISDRDIGLAKGSVFDTATTAPFSFDDEAAGRTLPPAPGSGIPPMISHAIDDYLPLTLAKNDCLDCHDRPAGIGKPVPKNKGQAAPASHYIKTTAGLSLAGSQFNCTSCHAPQAGAAPLVVNRAP